MKCKICGTRMIKKISLDVLSKEELKRFKALNTSKMCDLCRSEIGLNGLLSDLITC